MDAFAALMRGGRKATREQERERERGKNNSRQWGQVKKRRLTPSFVLVGRVDGISDQLDCSADDCAEWRQIQLVAYMVMLGAQCGDLVQAQMLRGGGGRGGRGGGGDRGGGGGRGGDGGGGGVADTVHWGVQCDKCGVYPIVGVRYKSMVLRVRVVLVCVRRVCVQQKQQQQE
ncbi:hypothetical protein B484DRAFT_416617 [Ochromonadaceae sp. CCMP2298]|nr:hypothetical protein B484DRAFT_416617 [Ochromonadaceae sp. CCMP2298]